MAKKPVFYLCETCKNLVGMLNSSGVTMECCGQDMVEIKANTVDAAKEKHVPVGVVAGDKVSVKVGSVAHPMGAEHLIDWVYLQTENGGQRKVLAAGGVPEAEFVLTGDKAVAVYAHCNLHGLWMSEL